MERMETLAKVEEGVCGSSSVGTFGNMPPQNLPPQMDISQRIMSIDLISQTIFECLSIQDLKSCTFVSKSWNRIARKAMHKSYDYKVTLNVSKPSEDSLLEFLNLVKDSTSLLHYNHISIHLKHHIFHASNFDNCQERLGECLKSFEHWNKLKIRKITIQDSNVHHPQCNVLASLKVMFQKLAPEVKHLKANVRSFNQVLKDHHYNLLFPKLISLDVDLVPGNGNLICDTVFNGGIPLLKELLGKVTQSELPRFTAAEKGCLVKNCDFSPSLTTADLEAIFSFAMDPLVRLQKFSILGCATPTESRNIFEHIIELILNNSEDTLVELRTSLGIVNFISKIRSRPLKNVRKLNLLFDKAQFRGDGLLPSIPFTALFPNLRSVHIFDDLSVNVAEILPENFSVPDQMVTSLCWSVSEITFESVSESLKRPFMYALWKSFPNVKEFTYIKPPSTVFNTPEILVRSWHFLFTERIWPGLETVRVNADSVEIKSLEPYIIGVSEEEVQNWRMGVYGYMNMTEFQYAASRVYVLNRRELRKLIFGLYNGYEGLRPFKYADACGFSRKPELTVVTLLLERLPV